MKYMGSKLAMLQNGLGESISAQIAKHERFIDLFSGSAAVAAHVAQKFEIEVLAYDLQQYSVVLARSILDREAPLPCEDLWREWNLRATTRFSRVEVPRPRKLTRAVVKQLRDWCSGQDGLPITVAYGGHYFSPEQSVWLDSLRQTLPRGEPNRTVALAALLQAASKCAAAPGHTAQPFQITRTAKPHLQEAWQKNVGLYVKKILSAISCKFALVRGRAEVMDANFAVEELRRSDLVFIDPPYSGVHYSRFYHVLETVAVGDCGEVSGVGRYPNSKYRPWSQYSVTSESALALDDLLESIAAAGATAIVTFPDHQCSNGLSGDLVRQISRRYFKVDELSVGSRFSTLGGRSDEAGRAARHNACELILCLTP